MTTSGDEGQRADDEPVDLEARQLCPDGACVGVIGHDGRCKECGRAADPAAVASAAAGSAYADFDGLEGGPDDGVHAVGVDSDGSDDDRELCTDGGCIGLIGADDKCKVCGRSSTGTAG